MAEPHNLTLHSSSSCTLEGNPWLPNAASGKPHSSEQPCEFGRPSRLRRQHQSDDAAAGQFVDPWRGC
jgi:hypothetical protein